MVIKSNSKHKISRKRRHTEKESEHERVARVATSFKQKEYSDAKKLRPLLPIKNESGALINQFLEEVEVAAEPMDEGGGEEQNESDVDDESGTHNIYQRKIQIAKICTNIINDPQNNIHEVKKLQKMLWEKKPRETSVTVRKLTIASLTSVFADIIPGYRIRLRTEEEKAVKLSKDVRILVTFEETLLQHYQLFLQSLEKMVKKPPKQSVKGQFLSREEQFDIALLATRSLCELYEKTSHFNYHKNIILVLVPLANDPRKSISELCCNALKSLFRSDKSGEATLSTVKVLCRMIKEQSGSKRGIDPEVLDTLLALHINQVDFDAMSAKGGKRRMTTKEKKKQAEERKKLSRGQLKYLKRQQKLESELKAVEATEKRETKLKYHTEIIQQVFLVYFRILKQKKGQGRPEKLLNSVLEGLAKFAHLINIDFFSDLIVVLQNLIASNELTHRQSLCCISTAFQVLSGQGEALNIDPTEFYKHLYSALFEIAYSTEEVNGKETGESRSSNMQLLLHCLNLMLNKRRRQVTLGRLLAFIKRLSTLSLHSHPASNALAVMEATSNLLHCNTKTNSLFDVESQTKGVYMPEIGDPEYCSASSACLWELHALRRHCSPMVNKQAERMLKEAARAQQRS